MQSNCLSLMSEYSVAFGPPLFLQGFLSNVSEHMVGHLGNPSATSVWFVGEMNRFRLDKPSGLNDILSSYEKEEIKRGQQCKDVGKAVKAFRRDFWGLFVLLYFKHLQLYQPLSTFGIGDFLQRYPELADAEASELSLLWSFRNFMAASVRLIPAKGNKDAHVYICTKLSEGSCAVYSRGGLRPGQRQPPRDLAFKRRDLICVREDKFKDWLSMVLPGPALAAVFDGDDDVVSDEHRVDSPVGTAQSFSDTHAGSSIPSQNAPRDDLLDSVGISRGRIEDPLTTAPKRSCVRSSGSSPAATGGLSTGTVELIAQVAGRDGLRSVQEDETFSTDFSLFDSIDPGDYVVGCNLTDTESIEPEGL